MNYLWWVFTIISCLSGLVACYATKINNTTLVNIAFYITTISSLMGISCVILGA
ncbi:hypothetical protein AKUA2103_PHAGE100320 (plasmid) [Apilactobacillus kunkeei]|nr:hypothetical protein AKUA2103_PHAGE100320 [Apilactobacillus kunkeei]CAI2699511.1 hypothetical protein AKUA1003_PHAGE100320 [Apilactobacillus kunkeei]